MIELELQKSDNATTKRLPLERIHADPTQPRKHFNMNSLNELADSIAVHGLLQPILVRPWNGDYQIVNGERRYRASKKLGLKTIDAVVRELSDSETADIRLAENIERDNLTAIELAWEFQRRVEEGQTHEEIAKRIGKTRSYVTQRLALLKLPETLQENVLRGRLSFSQARALLSVKSELREEVAKDIHETTPVKEIITSLKDFAVTRVTAAESTIQMFQRVDERAKEIADALTALGESLSIEERTYGIGPGCICARCPRKDECY